MKPNSVIKNTAIHGLIGALVGIVILHPVNSMVSWFGHGEIANEVPGIGLFLAATVAKTITGFMNYRGGNLLIGVADNGENLGLQEDFATLKHRNRDGFERSLVDLVTTRLGGDKCSLVHCVFYKIHGKDICRVVVEPSTKAVYCHDGKVPKYYVRTGNGTRELNIQEALAHIAERQA